MTKVDLLHNLRVKFNELSLREYLIVEEAFEELQEDLKHKKIAIQSRKARIKNLEEEKCELLGIIQGKDKVIKDFEAQISEMRCCENCNNFRHRIDHRCNTECKNLSKWEMKQKL